MPLDIAVLRISMRCAVDPLRKRVLIRWPTKLADNGRQKDKTQIESTGALGPQTFRDLRQEFVGRRRIANCPPFLHIDPGEHDLAAGIFSSQSSFDVSLTRDYRLCVEPLFVWCQTKVTAKDASATSSFLNPVQFALPNNL